MDPWLDQWHRVRRWFDRFTETNSGRSHTKDSDNYQDEVYAFFQNCYHLKDWLINDPVTSALVSDVETMISHSSDLRLCADLCNGSKHLLLTRSRASPDTKIGNRRFSMNLSGGTGDEEPPTVSVQYVVESAGSTFDAYAIAQACMSDWETYLRGKGLI